MEWLVFCMAGVLLDIYLIWLHFSRPYGKLPKKDYRSEMEEFFHHMDNLGMDYYNTKELLKSYTYKQLVEANKKLRKIKKHEQRSVVVQS